MAKSWEVTSRVSASTRGKALKGAKKQLSERQAKKAAEKEASKSKRVSLKDVKVQKGKRIIKGQEKTVYYKIHPKTGKKVYGFMSDGTRVPRGAKNYVQGKSKRCR